MLNRLFNRPAKTHQVYIEPFGATVTVGALETILQAALKAGLAYPYECQTGACSTCKTQLIEGDIKPLTDFAYVLEMDEMKGGTILACQSLAKTDLKVRVNTLDDGLPTIASRKFRGTVASVSKLTRDIFDVRIALDESLNYYAGQYANLTIPSVATSRSYSSAAAPLSQGSNELSFHIRLIPNGEVSSWFAASDRTGESIEIDGAVRHIPAASRRRSDHLYRRRQRHGRRSRRCWSRAASWTLTDRLRTSTAGGPKPISTMTL